MDVTTEHIAAQSHDAARVTDLRPAHVIERQIDCGLDQPLDAALGDGFIVCIDARHPNHLTVVEVGPDGGGDPARASTTFTDGPLWWVRVVGRDPVDVLPDSLGIGLLRTQAFDHFLIQQEQLVLLANDVLGIS